MLMQSDVATAASGTPATRAAPAGPLILLIDDEPSMLKMLGIVLRSQGYRTLEATCGAAALALAASYNPDLVLLDLGLPDTDGIEVARQLREWMAAPIVVISARGQEKDKVALLDIGANDYVTKPFSTGELLARMRVWLRQEARVASDSDQSTIEVGELRIDLARRLVFVGGREVHLTPIEYKLFATLMRNEGRIMTHEQLLEAVWGPPYRHQTQYLRVYMRSLRQKLEPDAARSRRLTTESGVGYRLRAD
jgi:two-component system, OmpR family, KDP operon response regulator KdpE